MKTLFLMHHDFKKVFYMNMNTSKRKDFEIMIFYLKENWLILKISSLKNLIELIMFFSRTLNKIEKNYWFTKLEIICLVWTLKKIRHLIKVSKHNIIVYTDHFTTVRIFKQTFLKIISTDKLNLQLVQVSQYIQNFCLWIFHKSEKTHLISNAFLWLSSEAFSDNIKFIDALHEDMKYIATMIKLSEKFRKHLQDRYQKNLKL